MNSELRDWLVGLTCFLYLNPFFLWSSFPGRSLFLFIHLLILLALVFDAFTKGVDRNKIPGAIFILLGTFYLKVFGGGNLGILVQYIYQVLSILLFYTFYSNYTESILNKFKKIFAYSLIPSIIIFPFISTYGINFIPHFNLKPPSYEMLKLISGVEYALYPFSVWIKNEYFCNEQGCLLRLSGLLNEPGLVGTYSALLLCLDDFNFRKRVNCILLIAGLMSMSLAFAVICLIYFLVAWSKSILFLLISMPLFSGVVGFLSDSHYYQRFLVRFNVVDGALVGMNRESESFGRALDEFIANGDLLFGNGANAHAALGFDVSSWNTIFYNNGLIGVVIFVAIYITLLSANGIKFNRENIGFIVAFVASVYQRPNILILPACLLIVYGASRKPLFHKEESHSLYKT